MQSRNKYFPLFCLVFPIESLLYIEVKKYILTSEKSSLVFTFSSDTKCSQKAAEDSELQVPRQLKLLRLSVDFCPEGSVLLQISVFYTSVVPN